MIPLSAVPAFLCFLNADAQPSRLQVPTVIDRPQPAGPAPTLTLDASPVANPQHPTQPQGPDADADSVALPASGIVVTGRRRRANDPFRSANSISSDAAQVTDKALIGPTTLRDFLGDAVDRLFLPVAIGRPFDRRPFTTPVNVLRTLDHRAEFDEQLRALRDDNPDSYVALRNYYLKRRADEIRRLHHRRKPDTPLPLTLPDPTVRDQSTTPAITGADNVRF